MPPDLTKAYENIVKFSERNFKRLDITNQKDYAAALKELRAVIGDAYRKYGSKGKLTYSEMQKFKRIQKLDMMISDAINKNTNHVAARTRKILSETADGSFGMSAAAMATVTGQVLTKELTADQIIEILQKPVSGISLNERMALRKSDLTIRVSAEVKRRLLQGAPVEDTWKGVKVTMEKVYAKGRTELADDFHRVSQDALRKEIELERKSGWIPTATWITAGDNKVRDAHRLLDGVTVDAGEQWEIPSGEWKGYRTWGPQQFGEPSLDYNCRCWVVANARKEDE